MQQVLAQFYAVVHSWTYVALALALAAAISALLLRAVGGVSRAAQLAATIAVLTGSLAPLIPWLGRSIDLEPGPLEAFTRAILYPLYYATVSARPLALVLLILVSTLIFGKIFCGWVCPVGVFQELVAIARSYRLFRIPQKACMASRSLLLLSFALLLIWKRRSLYDLVDPYPALGSGFGAGPIAFVALGVVGLGSLRFYRPFCGLVCPLGLLAHLVESLSVLRIGPTSECNRCGACLEGNTCPGLRAAVLGHPRQTECYACGSCMRACPLSAVRYTLRHSQPRAREEALSRGAVAGGKASG